jgi:hypothetical protein
MYCGQYPLRGPLEGVGPEIETFWALKWQRTLKVEILYFTYMKFGPEFWPKKS